MLPNISNEQQEVINSLKNNLNIIVDSVAGSGKTTCNLHIALNFPQSNILLLTYNSKLKIETREKIKQLNLSNIETHSYHSFCVKYYDETCFNDNVIFSILKLKKKPKRNFTYNIIILDEAQDINPTYFELLCKIILDNLLTPLICILGDKYQNIFTFNKADQRYITLIPQLFPNKNWSNKTLSISYRLPKEIAQFINKCMLNYDRIQTVKSINEKPRYIICDCFGDKVGTSSRTFEEVKYYLDLGYLPSEIFVLAPSIRNPVNPIRQLENKIKKELQNIPIYVPINDDEELNKDIIDGKMVFSTIHQTKGLERKVVILFNFDQSYFQFYKKTDNPFYCPNELYVATTRAKERLSLFHHYQNNFLTFLQKDLLPSLCHLDTKHLSIKEINFQKNIDTSVTDLTKNIPENIMESLLTFFQIQTIQKKKDKINIPSQIKQESGVESVSEITGIAVPMYFELLKKKYINILDRLIEEDFENKVKPKTQTASFSSFTNKPKEKEKKYALNRINLQTISSQELLYIANCWNTLKTGYLFKIYQINDYDWLKQENLNCLINRLDKLNVSNNAIFEYKCFIENQKELLNRKLIGYIDCIDKNNIYEFKCTNTLQNEHILQLGIYMYMYETLRSTDLNLEKIEYKKNTLLKTIFEDDLIELSNGLTGKVTKMYKNGNVNLKISNKTIKIQVNFVEKIITHSQKKLDLIKTIEEEIQQKIQKKNYFLYNILTDEMIEIKCDKLKEMMEFLIYHKFINDKVITDDEFLHNNKLIVEKYFTS